MVPAERRSEPRGDGTPVRVLYVEDDTRLARLTMSYLQTHSIEVVWVADGREGLRMSGSHAFDVVLLDIMLPGLDGLSVCRDMRKISDVPIIMLTAHGEEADKVMGLESGADDYLAKPYSSRELLARIRAQVRRARGAMSPAVGRPVKVGRLTLDPGALTVSLNDRFIAVTAYEFALLRALAERAGRILSREQLMDLAKGSAEESFDRSVDVHISRLRAKLESDPRRPVLIKTVRGAGYLLAVEGDT